MDFNIRYGTKANATCQAKKEGRTDNIRRSIRMRNVTVHIKMAVIHAFLNRTIENNDLIPMPNLSWNGEKIRCRHHQFYIYFCWLLIMFDVFTITYLCVCVSMDFIVLRMFELLMYFFSRYTADNRTLWLWNILTTEKVVYYRFYRFRITFSRLHLSPPTSKNRLFLNWHLIRKNSSKSQCLRNRSQNKKTPIDLVVIWYLPPLSK